MSDHRKQSRYHTPCEHSNVLILISSINTWERNCNWTSIDSTTGTKYSSGISLNIMLRRHSLLDKDFPPHWSWWHHGATIFSTYLALCYGILLATCGFPKEEYIMRNFGVLCYLEQAVELTNQLSVTWGTIIHIVVVVCSYLQPDSVTFSLKSVIYISIKFRTKYT